MVIAVPSSTVYDALVDFEKAPSIFSNIAKSRVDDPVCSQHLSVLVEVKSRTVINLTHHYAALNPDCSHSTRFISG
jgi:hypothetical protein